MSAPAPVAAFMRDWSLEATYPNAADLDALKAIIRPGTPVYLSAVPTRPIEHLVACAKAVRAAGLQPVPHLAVRNYADHASLSDFLMRVTGEADARRVLVISGDQDSSLGPFASALDAIESGTLQACGIEEIGIAGYPDGHPRIADSALESALVDKLAAAERVGLRVHIVTQFCFDATQILVWLRRLRARGIGIEVRIGMVGPTSVTALLRYARRCGVRASARGLARHAGTMRQLLTEATPDEIARALAVACAADNLGPAVSHFFSFGGVVRTAQWAVASSRHTPANVRSKVG